VQETVSDEARGDQLGVYSRDKLQHTEKSICDFQRGAGRWATVDEKRVL